MDTVARVAGVEADGGPGKGAVVRLQGCNFHCLYCHRAELIRSCTACGTCVTGCPAGALERVDGLRVVWDPSRCQGCGHCRRVCPNSSQPKTLAMTPPAVLRALAGAVPAGAVPRRLAPASPVVVSGGEPTLQPEFLRALLPLLRGRGARVILETNGSCAREVLTDLLPWLDGVVVGLKALDAALHRRLTGSGNARVLDNLRYLANSGRLAEVRTVVVPGFTDSPGAIGAVAGFLAALDPGIALRLIAFHPAGVRGVAAGWPPPADGVMERLAGVAREAGLRRVAPA